MRQGKEAVCRGCSRWKQEEGGLRGELLRPTSCLDAHAQQLVAHTESSVGLTAQAHKHLTTRCVHTNVRTCLCVPHSHCLSGACAVGQRPGQHSRGRRSSSRQDRLPSAAQGHWWWWGARHLHLPQQGGGAVTIQRVTEAGRAVLWKQRGEDTVCFEGVGVFERGFLSVIT